MNGNLTDFKPVKLNVTTNIHQKDDTPASCSNAKLQRRERSMHALPAQVRKMQQEGASYVNMPNNIYQRIFTDTFEYSVN
jgi:hypothetical protein